MSRGRPLEIIRPTRLEISIPEDMRTLMDLRLWSELEGRVPKGAYSQFINQLIREYFTKETLNGPVT